jgi:Tol biopolymer transport system component
MSERRLPIGVLAIVPLVIGLGVYAFTGQQQIVDPNATPTATAGASATAEATVAPIDAGLAAIQTSEAGASLTPTPQSAPLISHGAFHDGAWVRVNAGAGDCLNARNQPSMNEEWTIINICVPDGYEGLLSGSATQADAHWWWYLAGLGWVAEDYLTYIRDFDARANVAPELSPFGHDTIAFLRGPDIWVMKPDGSDQRLIIDRPDDDPATGKWTPRPEDLQWSPSGSMLSYNITRWDDVKPSIDLHVVTLADGSVTERVFENAAGGGWSPDGVHIGIIREPTPPQMGGGMEGVPGVLDVTTGGQLVLGSERFWQDRAPAFNYDGSLLMVNYATYSETTSERAIIIYDADGIEAHRIGFGRDAYYASARWSPTEDRIAMHLVEGGRARYAVYDLAQARVIAEAEPPPTSERIGGRCGGGDMWKTEWSRDGRRVLYSFQSGETGANGVWAWDVASGGQHVVLAASAGPATAGGGPYLLLSAYGADTSHIFWGVSDGGLPRIVTDGAQPVWFIGP